jgi:hypothetical protein
MSVSSVGSGTQTATVTTEHTLDTETSPGVYVLVVDTANMVNGDILELRLKTKDKSGGDSRLAYLATFAHVQICPHKYSIPVPVDTEIIATLKQTAGTGRNYDWNLLKMA